jgi:polyhydroxyalkanoate synthesis regulator phasin
MADNDPPPKDPLQKYLDAGIAFTNLTRARAEKLVSELIQDGEFRGDARAKVEELIERGRTSQEALFAQVRHEVDRQLEHFGITDLDDLAKQVAALIGRTAEAGRTTTKKGAASKTSAAKKAAAKKSAAKKSAAKKSAAKTSAAKKAAASKTSAAKKSAAKKSAARTSAAKTASSKKSAGKKSAGKAVKRSAPAGRTPPGTAG